MEPSGAQGPSGQSEAEPWDSPRTAHNDLVPDRQLARLRRDNPGRFAEDIADLIAAGERWRRWRERWQAKDGHRPPRSAVTTRLSAAHYTRAECRHHPRSTGSPRPSHPSNPPAPKHRQLRSYPPSGDDRGDHRERAKAARQGGRFTAREALGSRSGRWCRSAGRWSPRRGRLPCAGRARGGWCRPSSVRVGRRV